MAPKSFRYGITVYSSCMPCGSGTMWASSPTKVRGVPRAGRATARGAPAGGAGVCARVLRIATGAVRPRNDRDLHGKKVAYSGF